MSWLQNIFDRFSSIVRSFISFIIPIAESDAGKIISAALPLALSIVQQIATQGLTGTAARDAAVAALKTQIVQQGLAAGQDLATSTLNFIVETALQHLKATQ